MYGKNPKRTPLAGDGSALEIQEIFPTFQGEGPFTGYAAVFVRLGGCNLACEFCDTEFESFHTVKLEDILEQVNQQAHDQQGKRIRELVVITGGEPFRQPISLLCDELINQGYSVQIETNGTLFRPIHKQVHIICSPKNTGDGYHPIRLDLLRRLSALKFLISKDNKDYQSVSELGQEEHNIPVYVQPMDEYDEAKNRNNLELVKILAHKYGYRVSLQTHKIAGVP